MGGAELQRLSASTDCCSDLAFAPMRIYCSMVRLHQAILFVSFSLAIGGACHANTPAPLVFARAPKVHRPGGALCAAHARLRDASARAEAKTAGGHDPVHSSFDSDECDVDSECTAKPHGFCTVAHVEKGTNRNRCSYDQCLTDAECPAQYACECGTDLAHTCIAAACTLDSDCGGVPYCSFSVGHGLNSPDTYDPAADRGLFCHTRDDLCVDDDDCLRPQRCSYDRARNRWACQVFLGTG